MTQQPAQNDTVQAAPQSPNGTQRASEAHRRLLVELVVGVAIAFGAYMLIVDPIERQVRAARARVAELSGQSHRATDHDLTPERARHELVRLGDEVALVAQRSRLAEDESELFESVMTMAQAHGISVESLSPVQPRARAAGAAPAPTPGANGAPGTKPIQRVAYALSVRGQYGPVVAFIEALQGGAGYSVVRSVRLAPEATPGSRQVLAQIETEHFGYSEATLRPILRASEAARAETPRTGDLKSRGASNEPRPAANPPGAPPAHANVTEQP